MHFCLQGSMCRRMRIAFEEESTVGYLGALKLVRKSYMSRDATPMSERRKLLAAALCSNVQSRDEDPDIVLAFRDLARRWRIRTSPRTRLHELDVVVFVVGASFCDHVFDALFF